MEYRNFEQIVTEIVNSGYCATVAVPSAADVQVIDSVKEGVQRGIVYPILIGPADRIRQLLQECNCKPEKFMVIEPRKGQSDLEVAIELIKEGKAQILMKGMLETSDFLRPIVKKENGLRTGGVMSHIAFFELPGYNKLIAHTDSGMIIKGDLKTKKEIIKNACNAFHAMGYDEPKFAVICCKEKVDEKIAETMDAVALAEACKRGEFGRCSVVGPISYDIAMSKEIAAIKRYENQNVGEFDVLVVPDIHSGNILGKSWTVTAGARMAGVILGAKIPIIMTSRASSALERFYSLSVAARIAMGQNL